MIVTKTKIISVHVQLDLKVTLVAMAEQERLRTASMVEFTVLEYCKMPRPAAALILTGKLAELRTVGPHWVDKIWPEFEDEGQQKCSGRLNV